MCFNRLTLRRIFHRRHRDSTSGPILPPPEDVVLIDYRCVHSLRTLGFHFQIEKSSDVFLVRADYDHPDEQHRCLPGVSCGEKSWNLLMRQLYTGDMRRSMCASEHVPFAADLPSYHLSLTQQNGMAFHSELTGSMAEAFRKLFSEICQNL